MKSAELSDAALATLVIVVDQQVAALQSRSALSFRTRSASSSRENEHPEMVDASEQRSVIEKITGESFANFWEKYRRQLRRDLCLPGGMLYEQWKKWRHLQSMDCVKVGYGILAGMGIPHESLAPVTVAASVFLLQVVLKTGIETICEGCKSDDSAK